MSTESPIEVVNNGLVFCYDINNPTSYVGKPTTNYVTNASTMASWGNYSNGSATQISTPWGVGYGYYNAGSWNGMVRSVTLPAAGTYTFSAWQKYLGGHANQTGGSVYVSSWGGGDSSTYLNKAILGQWQRVSLTLACTSLTPSFYMISWGGTNNSDHSSFEMTAPQVESGSYATPFVNGTRSNTQALVDSSGNRTIDLSASSFDASGNLTFDSSKSNTVNIGVGSNYPHPYITLECWMKSSGLGSGMTIGGIFGLDYGRLVYITGAGGAVQLTLYETGNVTNIATTGVNVYSNTWRHVVALRRQTLTGGVGEIYVDGILRASGTDTNLNWNGLNQWSAMSAVIGRNPNDAPYYFNGSIAVAKIYNRGLTADEVLKNYNSSRSRFGL
jgi:hypothetical protein